ncbi:MAG: hypothetical protein JRN52_13375 [Nitrososphaerota archaeon]|nr:hypothetical protein [Nitrososphaerota archaeon]
MNKVKVLKTIVGLTGHVTHRSICPTGKARIQSNIANIITSVELKKYPAEPISFSCG